MMPFFQNRRRSAARILTGVLIGMFFLSPVVPFVSDRVAEAAYPVTEVGPLLAITSAIAGSTGASAVANNTNTFGKEWAFDMIAWGLANTLIKQMIKSMTQWVNNGFEGNPAFVTDLEGFMRKTADQVAGQFIWESEDLKFLCSPFALDIKLALDTQYREARDFQSQCTLSDVVGNMNNFLSGDFLEGGWDGWYELTQNPKSNPYGALLDAQAALSVKIGNKTLYEDKLLGFGDGFLSKKECEKDDVGNPIDKTCKIVTPGNVIQTQLNTTLGIPAGRLQIVDELNELIGALFSQLAGEILGGVGGLLGSTESQGGGGSVFDRLDAERDPTNPVPTTRVFDDALESERRYRDRLNEAVDMLVAAETYRADTYPEANNPTTAAERRCYDAGELPAALEQELTSLRTELEILDTLLLEIDALRIDFLVLTDPTSDEAAVAALIEKYNAQSKPAAQTAIMNTFLQIQSSGVLHSEMDYVELDQETLPGIEEDVTAFMESVDRACRGGRDDGGGG